MDSTAQELHKLLADRSSLSAERTSFKTTANRAFGKNLFGTEGENQKSMK
jgi:hypothetical protein